MEDKKKLLSDAKWNIDYNTAELEKVRKEREESVRYLIGLIKKAYKSEKEISPSTIADIQEAVKDKILVDNYGLSRLDYYKRKLAQSQEEFKKALGEQNNE